MEKRRIGRPPKKPIGKRASLGLKVTADIKARMERAAELSGRSQSQEAELRLERSFDRDAIDAKLDEILALLRKSC